MRFLLNCMKIRASVMWFLQHALNIMHTLNAGYILSLVLSEVTWRPDLFEIIARHNSNEMTFVKEFF
jgi:hypothetical protein